jgi:hypothetical protein
VVVALVSCNPDGSKSTTLTPDAGPGPLLVAVTVKVTASPTFGVALDTVLVTAMSAKEFVTVKPAAELKEVNANPVVTPM